MTKMENPAVLSRRAMLMGTGALVVSIGAPVSIEMLAGMVQDFANSTDTSQRVIDRCSLDELRPGADDGEKGAGQDGLGSGLLCLEELHNS